MDKYQATLAHMRVPDSEWGRREKYLQQRLHDGHVRVGTRKRRQTKLFNIDRSPSRRSKKHKSKGRIKSEPKEEIANREEEESTTDDEICLLLGSTPKLWSWCGRAKCGLVCRKCVYAVEDPFPRRPGHGPFPVDVDRVDGEIIAATNSAWL